MGQTFLGIEVLLIVSVALFGLHSLLRAGRRASLRQPPSMADYVFKVARVTGHSEYDVFQKAAEDWPVSGAVIERDFLHYLRTQEVPHYVNDFVRRNKKHIDELRLPAI